MYRKPTAIYPPAITKITVMKDDCIVITFDGNIIEYICPGLTSTENDMIDFWPRRFTIRKPHMELNFDSTFTLRYD
jgi:hypothetical protein